MDHNLTELEFFVLLAMANVLRYHGNTIIVIAEAVTSTVEGSAVFFIVIVERANAVRLANTTVT
jgi:hypothetical protein